jgi:DNA-binding beta-propeller fold protein YncE
LKGNFAFDALSPDGSKLYLIQHRSEQDVQHYTVRAYDLNAHKLLPGRIADKTQKGWLMQGWPVSRTTSDSGRWAYTLYANPGGMPFIHALDTVKGVAHCVGIPWPATDRDQNPVFSFALSLKGTKLLVKQNDGRTYRTVNTTNWKVSTTSR